MPLVMMVVLVKEALTRSSEMRGTVLMPLVTKVVLVKEVLTRSSEMRGTVLMPVVLTAVLVQSSFFLICATFTHTIMRRVFC